MTGCRPMTSADVCVYCRRHPVAPEWRPFCSERCKLLDLANWAKGTYRIPAERVDPPEADPDGDADNEDESAV
jgi:uncharacterized protein